jgi:hypothetical protein
MDRRCACAVSGVATGKLVCRGVIPIALDVDPSAAPCNRHGERMLAIRAFDSACKRRGCRPPSA